MPPTGMPDFAYIPPHPPFVSVIHADPQIAVFDKPAGLLTVPGKAAEHADCLESRAAALFAGARTVHRLDMDTSGLCIFGLSADAHRNLSMQFQRRKTAKRYIAVVYGSPAADAGEIDLPLRCDWPNRPRQMVDHAAGRAALTRWQVLARTGETSRLALTPVTGRSHQLRVHLAEQGCPIIGDRFYADARARDMAPRLLLHAEELTVHHPGDGARVTFHSPCPF